MERKAGRESRKAVVSILAEIIAAPMVSKALKDQKIFHQQRNKSILDVQVIRKCPNGVLRYRSFLTMDGIPERISVTMDHALAASYLAGLFFHPLSASIKSDGARKASSANFFHYPEAFPNPDGVKKLVLAHFSNDGRLISASMDREIASFPRVLHRQKAFLSSAGKKGQVDSIDQEISSA